MKSYQTLISCATLNKHLFDPSCVIIDCRFYLDDEMAGQEEYIRSHITGAIYAHLNTDLSSPVIQGKTGRHPLPDPNELARKLGNWGIDERIQVIVYDQKSGAMAARLWWLLQWLGHKDVAVLDGGFQSWISFGFPADDHIPSNNPRKFKIQMQRDMIADTVEVNQLSKASLNKLIDSRDPDRFSGENEPIDPVSGHIPNAINIPYKLNLNAEGHWKDPQDLKKRFHLIEGGKQDTSPVFYCGSGVTACHNILAFKRAGLRQAKLYPGSWSEWILNKENPVAKGEHP